MTKNQLPNPSNSPVCHLRRGLFVFLLLMLLPLIATAQRSLRVVSFHDDISVEKDGTSQVEEQIRYAFQGSYHGVYRSIPLLYPDKKLGSSFTLQLDQVSVHDESGAPLKYKSATKNGFLVLTIYVPGAEDTEKEVDIQYTVLNGVRFFKDHSEFDWNVTGNDTESPIDSASAVIKLPDSSIGELKAQAFTGTYNSKAQNATLTIDGTTITVQTTQGLGPHEGLTVETWMPQGAVTQPSAMRRFIFFLRANLILLMPILAFAVMFSLWYAIGRDPDPGISVAPQYEPPTGLTPVECGTVIDDSVDACDITSILVDLAVRGYIKIEETHVKGLLHTSTDYIFHKLKARDQWAGLEPFEQTVLDNFFAAGEDSTTLSSMKDHFYTALPTIKDQVLASLGDKGLYRIDPQTATGYTAAAALCIVFPFLAAQVLHFYNFLRSPVPLVVCLLLSAAIVFFFGRLLTAKSIKGARLLVAVKGFKEFMMRVDGERLKRYPPEIFEKYLPYAMALGVEKHWAQAFEGIIKDPPTWYVGAQQGNLFSTLIFMNMMSNMSSTAYDTFRSSPAPQSDASGSGFGGSGFSGGGFSGGGFGGGGTGGF